MRDTFENLPDTVRAAVLDGEGDALLRRPRPVRAEGARRRRRACITRACGTRRWNACSTARCRWSPRCTARWSAAGSNWPAPATSAWPTSTTFYALPEGSRGIFVGGGGAVRIPRLIGAARMTDMMLTGRVYNAQEGERAGFAQYLVPAGPGLRQGDGAGPARRAERAADQLRADARPAAHRRAAGRPGLPHRGADGRHRPERARGQGAACATSSKAAPPR